MLELTFTIDTLQGKISKYATCETALIHNKQLLKAYINQAFGTMSNAILQEFEQRERLSEVGANEEISYKTN